MAGGVGYAAEDHTGDTLSVARGRVGQAVANVDIQVVGRPFAHVVAADAADKHLIVVVQLQTADFCSGAGNGDVDRSESHTVLAHLNLVTIRTVGSPADAGTVGGLSHNGKTIYIRAFGLQFKSQVIEIDISII